LYPGRSCNRSYGSRARARDCPGQHRPKPRHSVRMRHGCCGVGTRPPRSNTSTAIASDMPKTASDTLGAHRPPLVVGVRRGSIIRPKPRSLPRPLEELSDPRRLLDRRSLFGRVTRSSRSQQEASPIVVARSAGSAVARAMRPAHLPTSPAALELRLVLHDVEYRRRTWWAGVASSPPLPLSGWPRAAEARRRRRVAARMPRSVIAIGAWLGSRLHKVLPASLERAPPPVRLIGYWAAGAIDSQREAWPRASAAVRRPLRAARHFLPAGSGLLSSVDRELCGTALCV